MTAGQIVARRQLERCAGRDRDAVRGQRQHGHLLVGDPHPQVDPVGRGGGHAAQRQGIEQPGAAPRVLVASAGDLGHRRRVGEQFDQDSLQQAAGPAGAEQAAIGHRGDDGWRPGHRGQPQVGAVALGEAEHVNGAVGQPATEADRGGGGDVAGVVVLDHDRAGALGQYPRQLVRACLGHARAGRVVRARLQVHGDGVAGQRGGERVGAHALLVDRYPDDGGADRFQQVQHGRERRVLHQYVVAEAHHGGGDPVERVQRAVDHGELLRRERPALAEHRFGAARGTRDSIMITIGTGIGGGLVLGGNLYRGSIGAAAELGHVVIDLQRRGRGAEPGAEAARGSRLRVVRRGSAR